MTDKTSDALIDSVLRNGSAHLTGNEAILMAKELRALRTAANPLQAVVKVKPLEWVRVLPSVQHAYTRFELTYVVEPYGDQWMLTLLSGADRKETLWPTESEAKAAAQADYERRILSAIETTPAPVSEVTEEMVEASCPGCSGTGDQGGNPNYGACDDCQGSGKVTQPLPAAMGGE